MNQSTMKNMIVLKNLPSNLVEEAIIILKTNKKVKKLEKVEKNKKKENHKEERKENDYILKEAEMLVSNYMARLEKKKETKNGSKKQMSRSYKRLKNYAFFASFLILIETMLLFVK